MLLNRCLLTVFRKNKPKYVTFTKYIQSGYLTNSNRKLTSLTSTVSGQDAYLSVPEFYAGKSVLVTGASGFVGKVLIQRVLDTCRDIAKVYVLIRAKGGENGERRLEKIIDTALFRTLRDENPEVLKKIVPVVGDLTADKLGIKAEDEQTLTERVSVVFHSAANVKLTEPLQRAMSTNLEGTRKVLELTKRMKNIQAFVHISTAYCNADQRVIEEKVYPPPAKLDDVYKFLEENGDNCGTNLQKLLNGKPNTYLFTKALAETYVAENHDHVPAIIIRPSIMTPIAKHPLPGWMDKLFGANMLLYNVGAGFNRVVYGDGNNPINMIPVDYTCNLAVIAAARCVNSKTVEVYNSSTGSLRPVSWGEVYKHFIEETIQSGSCDTLACLTSAYENTNCCSSIFASVQRCPPMDIKPSLGHHFISDEIPDPKTYYTKSRIVMKLATLLLMTGPAHLADFGLLATGRPPKHKNKMKEVIALRDSLDQFSSQTWRVVGDKAHDVSASLSASDRQLLPCDPSDLNWSEYLPLFSREVRRHVKSRRKYLEAKSKLKK